LRSRSGTPPAGHGAKLAVACRPASPWQSTRTIPTSCCSPPAIASTCPRTAASSGTRSFPSCPISRRSPSSVEASRGRKVTLSARTPCPNVTVRPRPCGTWPGTVPRRVPKGRVATGLGAGAVLEPELAPRDDDHGAADFHPFDLLRRPGRTRVELRRPAELDPLRDLDRVAC